MGSGFKDYWDNFVAQFTSIVPPKPPEPDQPHAQDGHRAAFLLDNAATRCMNVLSYQMSDDAFRAIVGRCKGWNNVWYGFIANHGDGNPPITSFYANDEHGGQIDQPKLDLMRKRIEYIRQQGFTFIPWFYSDDSNRHVTSKSLTVQGIYLKHARSLLGDLFTGDKVLGLELDEYWQESTVRALTAQLRTLYPHSRIGVHFTRLGKYTWAVNCGADVLYGQYGFGHSAGTVRTQTVDVINKLAGRCDFIACEYHKSSDSAEAKALGDAAMRGGASGTGNGRN